MAIQDVACVRAFERLCERAVAQGWHEANGGNLSYLLDEEDVRDSFAGADLRLAHPAAEAWHSLGHDVPALGGRYVLMTASGAYLSNMSSALSRCAGIIQMNEDGTAWRVAWGFEGDARPSSELQTHLAAFEAGMQAGDDACRVVYHAHCPNVLTLSAVIEPDARTWTRVLWQVMTESIVVFPQGIGVIPWMVPGSPELAQATVELMGTYKVCVWVNHGIMARAASFDEAFGQIETVEKSAAVYLQARAACGGEEPQHLVTDEQLRAICERYDITPNESFFG